VLAAYQGKAIMKVMEPKISEDFVEAFSFCIVLAFPMLDLLAIQNGWTATGVHKEVLAIQT
jgi:hypothetical protein